MFEDQDECIQWISPEKAVFKITNDGNFDDDTQRWLYSERTGKQI